MSGSEIKMTSALARRCGEVVLHELSGVIVRGEIAGSVRRGKQDGIGDVDLVVQPLSLMADREKWCPAFLNTVRNSARWRVLNKHLSEETRRITLQSAKDARFKVELYCAAEHRFGWILMLRTGPEDFCKALVQWARKRGHAFAGGGMTRKNQAMTHEPIETPTEQHVFDALGIPFIPPEARTQIGLERSLRLNPLHASALSEPVYSTVH